MLNRHPASQIPTRPGGDLCPAGKASPRSGADGLPFAGPWLLAPMEGITDPSFRDVMLATFPPPHVGGAFTEFLRISVASASPPVVARYLGRRRFAAPVGLQLMGSSAGLVAASARLAAELGAPLVDLNFGCPSKGALRGCAGSALLDEPPRLEALVAACVQAVDGRVPVSAKIRAGGEDARSVEVLARAAENGGASLLTIHCRTRREAYCEEVDWTRIARAVASVGIPVCGNGGIERHEDLERMRRETGCRFAMIGRAALRDPWIFEGRSATRGEAARFLLRYAEGMREHAPGSESGMMGRMKQLLRYWTAGGFVQGDRASWLRMERPGDLLDRLAAIEGGGPS